MNLKEAMILTVDFETTGIDTETDKPCEIGYCPVSHNGLEWAAHGDFSILLDPGIPIPAVASAVHHITDKDVERAGLPDDVFPNVFMPEWNMYAAHNADFDKAFAGEYGARSPWLCTYRLARHLLPDAPSHKNQVLRYWLGFHDVEGDAHRAGHDAKVTALILCHMLNNLENEFTIESIVALAESPVLLTGKVGFGKHHDKTWAECPHDYLRWMRGQGEQSPANPDGWDRDQWHTLNAILDRKYTA